MHDPGPQLDGGALHGVHAGEARVDVVDASNIDVDTNGETKTVVLKGTVATAAQKAAAEKIARDKAEGYSIVNRLEVK